ncbi:ATP-binding cassette sub-family A member 3-like [Teleopsis dalmanni]|uniref:ATP-binding cassette sub-family A member 3-like n=1 Tax=Teleopsis dalmanni TaxID=139649 RepID=UPI0018CE8813|nr:ATP-binding cassette sub-family A member 3-like [Teleopsis dalmanni]
MKGSFDSIGVASNSFIQERTANRNELTNFNKFSLQFWKILCTEFQEMWSRVFVVFLPTLFMLIFIMLRIFISIEEQYEVRYDPINFSDEWIFMLQDFSERKDHLTIELLAHKMITVEESFNNFPYNVFIPQIILCFAPNTQPGYVLIMEKAAKKLNSIDVIGFETCKQLRESMQINFYLAGVCFNEENLTKSNSYLQMFPKHLNYSLVFPSELRQYQKSFIGSSWNTKYLYDIGDRLEDRIGIEHVTYVREGFISLQQAVVESYMSLVFKSEKLRNITLRQFPYCTHYYDGLLTKITVSLPLAIVIGFIYPIMNLSKKIREDMESGFQTVIKILGIPYWIQVLAIHFNGFLNMIIASFFLTIAMKIHWSEGYGIFSKSSWSALMLLMLVFNLASLSFCVLIMSFTSHSKCASTLLAIIWVLTYLPYVQPKEKIVYDGSFNFLYIFSNTAIAAALDNLLSFEEFGRGIQWDNLFSSTEIKLHITTGSLILIMFGQSIVYLAIALCVEKLKLLGEHRNLFSTAPTENIIFADPDNNRFSLQQRATEVVEIDYKKVIIALNDVTKELDNVSVLKNITMNICEGDITVIMGHNSSGKTTLLSVIVGLIRPTSGTVVINGFDIHTNPELGLRSVGMSVGDATLIKNLTVREQLTFFGALKGINDTQTQSEVEKYIRAMNLEEKGDTVTQDLSTGMKQYLKVSSALIGGSKIVVLDEPSMGLDMESRKLLWELLLSEKTGRTIFLITQLCEEADALADRFGILSGGKLQCYGSSYFLKNLYCTGYRLLLIKDVNCNIKTVTETIRKFIPNIQAEYVLGNEISFRLEDKYVEVFSRLLQEIYRQQNILSIRSFSICESSLYDVFMQRGSEYPSYGDHRRHSQIMNGISVNEEEHQEFLEIYDYEPLTGFQLWLSQFYALVIKRVAFQYYHIALTILQLVALIVFPIISLALTSVDVKRAQLTPMTFDLSQYYHSTAMISVGTDVFIGDDKPERVYEHQLFYQHYPHIGLYTGDENIESFFIKKQLQNTDYVNHDYLIGATFEKEYITAWFNNYPLHTAPLSLNVIHNTLAQCNDLNAKVTVTLDPLPFSTEFSATLDSFWNQKSIGFFLPRNIALCFSILWPFQCHFFAKERMSGFKTLQSIAGLTEVSYWISSFLTNMTFIVIESLIIVSINFASMTSYGGQTTVAIWFLIVLVMSGICIISLTYLVSIFFKDFNTTYEIIVIFLLFNIVCHCVFCEILYQRFGFLTNSHIYQNCKMILRILPLFSMVRGLEKVFRNGNLQAMCSDKTINFVSKYVEHCGFVPNCCFEFDMWKWDGGILKEVFCLTLLTVISWILIYLLYYRDLMHYQKFRNLNLSLAKTDFETYHRSEDTHSTERNVFTESKYVQNMSTDEQHYTPLVCDQLTFFRNEVAIISSLSFALHSYDCFGVLGANGSGKSTMFKLLSGVLSLTEGHIKYEGLELKDHKAEIYKMIGYMADVNLIMDEYTGWQILKIMLLLRGVPRNKISKTINTVAKIMCFQHCLHFPLVKYSVGLRKRIGVAVALMGRTKILLLDNPTQGLDTANRRIVYNLIYKLQQTGVAIVFSSDMGSDCELLCNRVAILYRGRFRALGSLSSIIEIENDVYILRVKVKNLQEFNRQRLMSNRNQFFQVQSFMELTYQDAKIRGIWGNVIIYAIPISENVTLSKIFTTMRRYSSQLSIEDFQISSNSIAMFITNFER